MPKTEQQTRPTLTPRKPHFIPRNGAVPAAAEKDRHPTRLLRATENTTRRAKAMAVMGVAAPS